MQFKYETEDKGEIIVMTDLNLTICELKKKKSVLSLISDLIY